MSIARPGIGLLLDGATPGLGGALGRLIGFHHARLGGAAAAERHLAVATEALVEAHAAGHACLPLDELAASAGLGAAALRRVLLASPVVLAVRADGQAVEAASTADAGPAIAPGERVAPPPDRPLVLDDHGRLYLARHFDSELRLAVALHALAGEADPVAPPMPAGAGAALPAGVTGDLFAELLPPPAQAPAGTSPAATGAVSALVDRLFHGLRPNPAQRAAVERVLAQRLVVITGGPGTGKTTTVARCIAAVLEAEPDTRVLLAAPTGKAAARMNEALASQLALLPADLVARRRHLPPARTVHALLGLVPGKADAIRHHAGRPLDADLVVIDEVSMLGLTLARRLADAVRPGARLVLLGDPDQLASVETGLVLAELAAGDAPPLPQAIARLAAGQRFAADSPVGRLAAALRSGKATAVLDALALPGGGAPVSLDPRPLGDTALARELLPLFDTTLAELARPDCAPAAALAAFERARVLCAVHDGPRGTRALNAALGRLVARRLADAGRADAALAGDWPHGRPLLVTRNDPGTGLANGDVGLVLHGEDGPRAWFRLGDELRDFAVTRLPACETAWALSIHKAQGSEFDRVEIVLPPPVEGAAQRLLARELIYTAVTRARRELRLWADPALLAACVGRVTRRHSGLADRLRALAACGSAPASALVDASGMTAADLRD
ncbi:exodeoxyribonuclease V subunit alpha [Derxia gummosa]|uniref:RecBCD enzyme subunit RecD n=1 Tax=Derxia gummosa DSM 723 TaxID=1121388 RepID=A0A8B6X9K9_9BURK|nr:exodeoxyribonuclease V subunit alpha [Derxia gummosa]